MQPNSIDIYRNFCIFLDLKAFGSKNFSCRIFLLATAARCLTKNSKRCQNLSHTDQFVFAVCTIFISAKRLNRLAVLLKPKTILNFHSALVRRKYSQLFSYKIRGKPGTKGPSQALIDLVWEYKKRNPRFGYLRIAMQINKHFGFEIDDDMVRRILNKYYKPYPSDTSGPSWLSLLGHSKDSLWSLDLFRAESIFLKSHRVMVVMDQWSRKIIGFAVHQGELTTLQLCLMFNKIVVGRSLPKRLSTDNEQLFQNVKWKANLSILEIEEVKSVPYTPISHPFVERLIRSIREDFLNQTFFWNGLDLQRKLDDYKVYFNQHRSHFGIEAMTPNQKCGTINVRIKPMNFRWQKHLRGLVELPQAA